MVVSLSKTVVVYYTKCNNGILHYVDQRLAPQGKQDTMDDSNKYIERTTAIGLARYARDYYRAAVAADDDLGQDKGYEFIAPSPVLFLVAHSIELGLKAYLRHQGVPLKKTINLGHDLNRCWREAVEQGVIEHVELTGVDLEVLGLISELHSSTVLRYIQTGYKRYPVFGPLQELTEKILDGICPLVGYK